MGNYFNLRSRAVRIKGKIKFGEKNIAQKFCKLRRLKQFAFFVIIEIMKKNLFFLLVAFLASNIFAQQIELPFNSSWSEKEIENLENGEIVIRNIKKSKRISILPGTNKYSDEMLENFEQLDPSYLAEIIYKMPKRGNESIINQAVQIFSDTDLYKEIIYSDEKKGKERPLFPKAEIKERNDSDGEIRIATNLRMDMLSSYDSELIIKSDDGFFFEQHNTTPLKWRSFTAVKSGKMVASICCFEHGENYYVYALGGIKAPRIPLVLYEIERQFIGRIEDFTVFYINRFKINR